MNTRINIEKEKSAARLELDKLLVARGAATLDGAKVNHAQIKRLEDTLKALDDASAELVRRERIAEQERQAASRKRLAKALLEAEQARLSASLIGRLGSSAFRLNTDLVSPSA